VSAKSNQSARLTQRATICPFASERSIQVFQSSSPENIRLALMLMLVPTFRKTAYREHAPWMAYLWTPAWIDCVRTLDLVNCWAE
jgi:hypothetical protein